MKYYKNTDLAKLYKVSEKSVRNWIDAAEAGKLDLQLHTENSKAYIANVAKNTAVIEVLVEKGKKYKNSRGFKEVRPSQKFYDLYTPKQIIDIISNLEIHHETPIQYTYFNSGATRWDSYVKHLLEEDASNALTNTVHLIDMNMAYLDEVLSTYSSVNILDLGVGNAMPVRGLLEHFLANGKLKRYIGLDISSELLNIAEQNIHEWFDGKVKVETHIRDIVYERFDDLLVADAFGDDAGSTATIVLFLGGTLANFREPSHTLSTIHDSMGKQDLLLYSKKLDNPKARRFFDLAAPGQQAIELVLQLMNIDPSFYTVDQLFDEQKKARAVYAQLDVSVAVEFELNSQKRVVELSKGDKILLWRAKHQTMVEVITQYDESDFDLVQATRSKDQTYLLMISKIKTAQ